MLSAIYSWTILMKFEFSGQFFEKYSDFKFNENPSSRNWVVSCGQTDGRADMMELIVASLSFVTAPKKTLGHVEQVSVYKA